MPAFPQFSIRNLEHDGSVSVELRGDDIEITAPDFVGELALLLPEGGRVGLERWERHSGGHRPDRLGSEHAQP